MEQKFITQALLEGLDVSTPVGDYKPYDFIVQNGDGLLHKVQVKGTGTLATKAVKTYYKVITAKGSSPKQIYDQREVDMFACLAGETWYIIPIKALKKRKTINLYPHRPNVDGIYEEYKERWGLFKDHTPYLEEPKNG